MEGITIFLNKHFISSKRRLHPCSYMFKTFLALKHNWQAQWFNNLVIEMSKKVLIVEHFVHFMW